MKRHKRWITSKVAICVTCGARHEGYSATDWARQHAQKHRHKTNAETAYVIHYDYREASDAD